MGLGLTQTASRKFFESRIINLLCIYSAVPSGGTYYFKHYATSENEYLINLLSAHIIISSVAVKYKNSSYSLLSKPLKMLCIST